MRAGNCFYDFCELLYFSLCHFVCPWTTLRFRCLADQSICFSCAKSDSNRPAAFPRSIVVKIYGQMVDDKHWIKSNFIAIDGKLITEKAYQIVFILSRRWLTFVFSSTTFWLARETKNSNWLCSYVKFNGFCFSFFQIASFFLWMSGKQSPVNDSVKNIWVYCREVK